MRQAHLSKGCRQEAQFLTFMSLKDEKQPGSHVEMAVLVAYYLSDTC